jgi:pilus assembly protein CpaE
VLANLISGETLRILLVGKDEEIKAQVERALAGRAGDYRVYWVSQPDLAASRAQDLLPQAVLIDDDLGATTQAALIGALAARLPSVPIVALVRADGLSLARQAVLAGARGFVGKPVQPEELLNALRQVLGQRKMTPVENEAADAASGRVIVFIAPKGGTGRTTTALNTAVCLRQLSGDPAVIVDADYAAPALDVALNIPADHDISDLVEKIAQLDRDVINSVLPLHASHIRVLLAPAPGNMDPITLPQVQGVIVWLRRMFAWVVVDTGLPLDETAYGYLDSADRIVMTVLPEMIGLRNTRTMLDQLYARGYPEDKIWLVLNRANMGGGVSVKDIEERLRVRVRYRIPDDQPLATLSINRGVPMAMSHPQSAVARAIRGLAQELVRDANGEQGVTNNVNEPTHAGLFGRLRGTRPAGA